MQQPPQQQFPGVARSDPECIRNLMVNYIPTTIDEVQLRQLFEMYGPVESVKIVVDRESRTSRGYGFVKFRFAISAAHAIQYLNGYPLLNKRLKVAYSKQDEAQKCLSNPQEMGSGMSMPGALAGAGGYTGMDAAAMDPNYMWAQQLYMQQLAALQMMQMAQMPQQHQHQHQHQHQQQQQQQQRMDGSDKAQSQ